MDTAKCIMLLLVCIALTSVTPSEAAFKSKLSIHTAFDNGGPLSWKFINATKPPVVKLLDNFQPAAAIKAASPQTIIIGRIYLANQPEAGDPVQAAQDWFNQYGKGAVANAPHVDFWEGYNEPGCGSTDDMTWLAQFEAERVKLLASVGARASIGNFGTGSPDVTQPDVVNAFMPAIDAAIANNGILGLHEYNSPNLTACFDNSTGEGWMTGRYRKLYRHFLIPQNRTLPLVISENGIDNSPCGSPNFGGFNKYCDWWAQHGYGSNCAQVYVDQLAWYDQQVMRQDSFVIGSTIYQLEDPGQWQSYDLSTALDELIAYIQTQT